MNIFNDQRKSDLRVVIATLLPVYQGASLIEKLEQILLVIFCSENNNTVIGLAVFLDNKIYWQQFYPPAVSFHSKMFLELNDRKAFGDYEKEGLWTTTR